MVRDSLVSTAIVEVSIAYTAGAVAAVGRYGWLRCGSTKRPRGFNGEIARALQEEKP